MGTLRQSVTIHCILTVYHSVNFENKTIGIIGGGSSAIQIIPKLQKLPGTKLSCFIRSKTWISKPIGDSLMESLGIEDNTCKSSNM